ncbi:MAG TPA: hypothetical protein VME69_11970 [Methylocella sp.]|nr:hypothetical protein [Methylocella sp.]
MTDAFTPSILAYLRTLSYTISLYLYRLRSKWRRLRRAVLYAKGRLSQDDAQDLLLDCCAPAGWHPLLILSVDDTLEEALETCRVGGGAHRRAHLRPPHKPDEQFSRIRLS